MENKIYDLLEKVYVELQEVKTEVKQNSTDIVDLKKQVTNIEVNHGKKIEALLDGYKANTELLNEIRDEVAKHEEVIIKRVK